jgi:hypothetical protein
MDVVFRFVDKDGVLQERFFQLIHVKNTKSLTLKGELCALNPSMPLMFKIFMAKDTIGKQHEGGI